MRIEGVVFLDHTADVGIGVAAPTLDALFHRAALGMLALLRGEDDEPDSVHSPGNPQGADGQRGHDDPDRLVALTAATLPSLLADWLREILFLHEIDGRDYVAADFDTLDPAPPPPATPAPATLRARVRTAASVGAVREIKGVTYHELRVERTGGGWEAQVIFDV